MKRTAACLAAASLFVLTAGAQPAFAADEPTATREPGVSVSADPESPTGYTATFVYEDAPGLENVVLYSDTFLLWDEDAPTYSGPSGLNLNSVTPEQRAMYGHEPSEYAESYWPGGGSGSSRLDIPLTEDTEHGVWYTEVPLMSGAFVYNYQLTIDGETTSRHDDPANPSLVNEATGVRSLSSMVYVPYDEATQGSGPGRDRSLELPRTDGRTGSVETLVYPALGGTDRGMSVYLPDGYDPDRAEPYNVLYINMGNSGDQFGNELRWMNEGALPNIVDNLVAQGQEPFVAVSMNYQDWRHDFTRIQPDVLEHVLPFVESRYNVAADREGRGYAGLSAGAGTTARFLLNNPDVFSQFGIWSNGVQPTDEQLDRVAQYADDISIQIGLGTWDYVTGGRAMSAALSERGIEHDFVEMPGGHDWELWQLLFADFAADHLWAVSDVDAPADLEPGVTVAPDEASPTGYTATFVYEDEPGLQDVVLYSDTFRLWHEDAPVFTGSSGLNLNNVSADDLERYGREPAGYAENYWPGGGSGSSRLDVPMTEVPDQGVWFAQLPLMSGAFVYNYQTTIDGQTTARHDDPANPALVNEATGVRSLSSMVYVPYDEDKQGSGPGRDRSLELPRTDDRTGTVQTITYPALGGTDRGMSVYLPHGYDANREEPYNVLFINMGNSGDQFGNELRWMNEGALPNIVDNLVADGHEPFVAVSMNYQDWRHDFERIEPDVLEHVIPFVEEHYNVADTREGRGYAGLSMGAATTARFLLNDPEVFSQYGIWSNGVEATEEQLEAVEEYADSTTIQIGLGSWDYVTGGRGLSAALFERGFDHDFTVLPGGHDWELWQLLLADFAENHLWQMDAAPEEPSAPDDGETGGPGSGQGSDGDVDDPAEAGEVGLAATGGELNAVLPLTALAALLAGTSLLVLRRRSTRH